MNDRSFVVGDEPTLELQIRHGSVRILTGEPGTIDVSVDGADRNLERSAVHQRGNTVIVHSLSRWLGSLEVTAVVPPGTAVHAVLGSADLSVDGDLRSLTAEIGSGDVNAGRVAGDVSMVAASGDVRIGRVGGTARVTTASGDVKLGPVGGDAELNSASGDIVIARADRINARTASGDFKVEAFDGSELAFTSKSGDARIGLVSGLIVDVDVQTQSGDVRNGFTLSDEPAATSGAATLVIKTLSGDIALFSA